MSDERLLAGKRGALGVGLPEAPRHSWGEWGPAGPEGPVDAGPALGVLAELAELGLRVLVVGRLKRESGTPRRA